MRGVQRRPVGGPPTGPCQQLGPDPAVWEVDRGDGAGAAGVGATQRGRDQCVGDDDLGTEPEGDVADLAGEVGAEQHRGVGVEVGLERPGGRRRHRGVDLPAGRPGDAEHHGVVPGIPEPVTEAGHRQDVAGAGIRRQQNSHAAYISRARRPGLVRTPARCRRRTRAGTGRGSPWSRPTAAGRCRGRC